MRMIKFKKFWNLLGVKISFITKIKSIIAALMRLEETVTVSYTHLLNIINSSEIFDVDIDL